MSPLARKPSSRRSRRVRPLPSPGLASGERPSRVVIEHVRPIVDGGGFPIKRVPGEAVRVTARIFVDGHDELAAVLRWRPLGGAWQESPLRPVANDEWVGQFAATTLGRHEYGVQAWVDRFAGWRRWLYKKWELREDIAADVPEGVALIERAMKGAKAEDRQALRRRLHRIQQSRGASEQMDAIMDEELSSLMARYDDRAGAATLEPALPLVVERERARAGAWYEFFPRSAGPDPSRGATLREAAERLPYIARMGFDVVYLPPIHPIGRSFRKGRNNTLDAGPRDPGSPWAIGDQAGGHKSVHPALGTLADVGAFIAAARKLGLEVALDLAFQCSPDHPYVRQHPEWFKHRPDGSIRYAENPPKKYQDILPFDFDCEAWRSLWLELKSIVTFWVEHGIRLFRVDNPHTKPLRFWEWLIREVQAEHPDVVLLSEAFTRPALLNHLAKAGFSQSYTYFTWRNTKRELTEYLTELTRPPVREYLRPNLFTNTPDILHAYLQHGGEPAFRVRLLLAATLSSNYGIYGPAFELCETEAVPGSEEYRDSEKYQIRHWDVQRPGLQELIRRVNAVRRQQPALQQTKLLRFLHADNDQLLCYGKRVETDPGSLIVIVNLDPKWPQSGWVRVEFEDPRPTDQTAYEVQDLLSGERYVWKGEWNFVRLEPGASPAHILKVPHRIALDP